MLKQHDSLIMQQSLNRDLYRFSGMFSALMKLEEFSGQNPLHGVTATGRKKSGDDILNDVDEINNLLSVLSGDEQLIALLCLSTGGRGGVE